ncbi:acetyltransferase, GNAT family [Pseudohyphozyma bogoriensis]|nr:acetyltransferase, GNAT family [Pseudohyphozyma bogoriensis]
MVKWRYIASLKLKDVALPPGPGVDLVKEAFASLAESKVALVTSVAQVNAVKHPPSDPFYQEAKETLGKRRPRARKAHKRFKKAVLESAQEQQEMAELRSSAGGPRKRKTFGEYVLPGGDEESGTEEGSSVDELDEVQINWGTQLNGSGRATRRRPSDAARVPSHERTPVGDVFDKEVTPAPTPPVGPLPPPYLLGRAIYDFEPQDADERGFLTFRKGDLIHVTGAFEGVSSWWYGKRKDKCGMFLAYHIEKVDEVPKDDPAAPTKGHQRYLSEADVSSLETTSYQRQLRAYELAIEGIIANPGKATNDEYRDLMAKLESTLSKYHKNLLRYRDLQTLEKTTWSDADDFVHAILPRLPKTAKSTVDAGDFVTPSGRGDTFAQMSASLGMDGLFSRIIIRLHGINTGTLKLKPLDARYRSSITQTRDTLTRFILSGAGAVFLVAPVVGMFFCTARVQLIILSGMVFLTSMLFAMSRTSPSNVLLGSAAIAAVLTTIRFRKDGAEDVYVGDYQMRRDEGMEGIEDLQERASAVKKNVERSRGDPEIVWTHGFFILSEFERQGIISDIIATMINTFLVPVLNGRVMIADRGGDLRETWTFEWRRKD